MKSDRELLEAAAQAAGMQHKWHADGLMVDERCGAWNPLVDDADAFRLAVKLGISLDRTSNRCWSWRAGEAGLGVCEEFYRDDPYAATRRAIVRAAASLQDPQENRDV